MSKKKKVPKSLEHWLNPQSLSFGVLDLGNSEQKSMVHGIRSTVGRMSNQIWYMSDSQWENIKVTYKAQKAKFAHSQAFKFRIPKSDSNPEIRWSPVIVGDVASSFATRPSKITGEQKYTYEYFGALVVANLMRLFPDGADNIVLAVAYPVGAANLVDEISKIVNGWHYALTVDGRKLKWNVSEVTFFVEQSGGIAYYLNQPTAAYNPNDLSAGDQILVVDPGGGETSLTTVSVQRDELGNLQLIPIYSDEASPSFYIGLNECVQRLRNELKNNVDEFKRIKVDKLQYRTVADALRYNAIQYRSDFIPLPKQVIDNSIYTVTDPIHEIYSNQMNDGAEFVMVLVSGGGGAVLFDVIKNECTPHPTIDTCAERDHLMYANLYGGDIILNQYREVKIQEAMRYAK